MFKNILNDIQGINLYGIVSICIFFGIFVAMLIWACALKKNYLNKMSALPLESGEKDVSDHISS